MVSGEQLQDWRSHAQRIENEVARVVVGQQQTLRLINVALFARGHVLLEGGVGVGKTTVLRAFARVVGGDFERVEGTIDLMPGDLVYHTYVDADGKPRIEPGPLLRHGEQLTTFFFNEINRARPQVQSLLLRAMAERSVWAFDREHRFPHMLQRQHRAELRLTPRPLQKHDELARDIERQCASVIFFEHVASPAPMRSRCRTATRAESAPLRRARIGTTAEIAIGSDQAFRSTRVAPARRSSRCRHVRFHRETAAYESDSARL